MKYNNIFEVVKQTLTGRLLQVLEFLQPDGRVIGKEYTCAKITGGIGESCKTNINTGVGSDFATGESWGDIIALTALINNSSQLEAAEFLAEIFNIDVADSNTNLKKTIISNRTFQNVIINPVPANAPPLPAKYKKGIIHEYKNELSQRLFYVIRITKSGGKKSFFPVCLCTNSQGCMEWRKIAPKRPRSLYRREYLRKSNPDTPVLIVEGEKTANNAAILFPNYICLSWSGGANAVKESDWYLISDRDVTIWPDNDKAGINATLEISKLLKDKYAKKTKIVLPPEVFPDKWDVADPAPDGMNLNTLLQTAAYREDFLKALKAKDSKYQVMERTEADEDFDFTIPKWPILSKDALNGFAGEFVKLATAESEADPAAVLVTFLTRFAAEIYSFEVRKGAYLLIGDTKHAPRLFIVVCGNSSKARKGTSSQPVTRLFERSLCSPEDLAKLNLLPPAKISGGPLSSGEGLGFQLSEDTSDKRLFILDEELASGLSCTKRDGNTLSMAIRVFWDGGTYAPLTKSNRVTVSGAHLCIVSHITQHELSTMLSSIQMSNGFGNRFLWVCAKRPKLVALPRPMPEDELAKLQLKLWQLVKSAQGVGEVTLTPKGTKRWFVMYEELTKEHHGLYGAITARAEAQTIRLALIYALLDGKKEVDVQHINSALALWNYASDSARVLFHDRAVDPIEQKILSALSSGSLTASELSRALNNHVPKNKLKSTLISLEASNRITTQTEQTGGRPRTIITLCEKS